MRLTGYDAYGDVVASEEMVILASRKTTEEDLHNIILHLTEKLAKYEDLEEALIGHTGCGFKTWIERTTSLFDEQLKR